MSCAAKRIRLLAFVLLAGLPSPMLLQADSIWGRRYFYRAFLFVDTRPRRIGDIVTITVTETTNITNDDKRDLSKEKKKGLGFSGKGNIAGTSMGALRKTAAGAEITSDLTKEYIGQSAFSSGQLFLDRMTATVVAVLPNGNLVIEGCRQRVVGPEVRTLHVTGMIRPIDIGTANTIDSSYISNLHMEYLGKGPQSCYTTPGILSRKWNALWPF